jgi:D-serine deaminase-like pyridoxal phosphate-dependent protein
VTAQGSAYHRFRRALDRRNVTEALSCASELEHVGLSEALELCLLLTKQPARFERAALRWHGRYCRETRDVTFDEGVAVLVSSARGAATRRTSPSSRGIEQRRTGAIVVQDLQGDI